MNIEPIILRKKIEERRTVGAFPGLEQGQRTVRRSARPDSARGGELAAGRTGIAERDSQFIESHHQAALC
jgi:hypothetical protein